MSWKGANHTVTCHLIVSLSSPHSSAAPPNKHTYKYTPGIGGERILKTNKQRIDLLRRITEVLITSDPSPLLSKSAPLLSLVRCSIYVSALSTPISLPPFAFLLRIFSPIFFSSHIQGSRGVFLFKETETSPTVVTKSVKGLSIWWRSFTVLSTLKPKRGN